MKINLHPFGKLEAQQKDFRDKVTLPSEVRLDLAHGIVHGLNDLTRSIAGLHPHKMSIAVLGAQPTPVREVVTGFAGQGYAVQELPVSFAKPDEGLLKEAWEKLKKDTLFVVTSAIEPLTGAVYPYEWIRGIAPQKNIFTLISMPSDALKRGLIIPASPFEGIVADPLWGEDDRLVVVLKGERCQGDRLFWGEPHFSDRALHNIENKLMELQKSGGLNKDEDKNLVLEFEKKMTAELTPVDYLGAGVERLYDRAVLFIPGVNGEAVMHGLKDGGYEVFTAAACAWNSPHLNPWLPKLGFAPELVESSVIIPVTTLKKVGFAEKLVEVVRHLRKISGF